MFKINLLLRKDVPSNLILSSFFFEYCEKELNLVLPVVFAIILCPVGTGIKSSIAFMSQRMSGEEPPPPYDRVVIHIPQETGTYCVNAKLSLFIGFLRQLIMKYFGKKSAPVEIFINLFC